MIPGENFTTAQKFADLDVEQAVLFNLLVDTYEVDTRMFGEMALTEEMFVEARHRHIFRAFRYLWQNKFATDLPSLISRLEDQGVLEEVGGYEYLVELAALPVVLSFSHDRMLRHIYRRRVIAKAASDIINLAHNHKDAETLHQKFLEITTAVVRETAPSTSSFISAAAAMDEADKDVQRVREKGTGVIDFSSYFQCLNERIGGYVRGDLNIVMADTSIGKSLFAVEEAIHHAQTYGPVGYFTLEMKAKTLAMRGAGFLVDVPYRDIRRGRLTESQWALYNTGRTQMRQLPIYFDQTTTNINQLHARVLQLYDRYGFSMVVIDYLQLLYDENGNNQSWVIDATTRRLLNIARSMDQATFLVLSGTHRHLGADPRPTLKSGFGSSAIEKTPDVVLGLYRHYHYYREATALKEVGEVIGLKTRNDALFSEKVRFTNGYWRNPTGAPDAIEEFLGGASDDLLF